MVFLLEKNANMSLKCMNINQFESRFFFRLDKRKWQTKQYGYEPIDF